MHEASIILSVLDIAEDHCRKAGYSEIQSIQLRIGSASGILPDALQMAFEIVREGTMAEDAKLLIEEISLGGTCKGCSNDFTTTEQFILTCPECGSKDFMLDKGREMEITEIEVE
ncbi:MAG: hydrogenase maturation nickel metallochaperone HypA [Thermodesulfovibrionales bacterium]|nr:hydrogenase maturation nickel metallochaperone HypA [Thermodesulfovibrionales bacterium]